MTLSPPLRFTKTDDATRYEGFAYSLGGAYYKLYLEHLSQTRKQLATFHQYYNEQKKELNDVLMIHSLSTQNKVQKQLVAHPSKGHRQIRKPDFSITFDKGTVLDLENDVEYQKLKQQRLRELKQQLQTEQKARLQEYEDELQAMVKASNDIILEARTIINANEYVGSKRRHQKVVKNPQVTLQNQSSPIIELKPNTVDPPDNATNDSLGGTQQLEPTHILQTRYKLQDLEAMKTQYLVVHYQLLKQFDRDFKPYMAVFVQSRDLKLEDRVDNILARIPSDLAELVVRARLVAKPELIDGYSLTFEGQQPCEAIQTDMYQDFLNQSVRARLAAHNAVFHRVTELQQADVAFKRQRAAEHREHAEELALATAPATPAEPDPTIAAFFRDKCERYQQKLQQQKDALQAFKDERKTQQSQKTAREQEKLLQMEQQSRQKLQILRENRIKRLDTTNKRANALASQRAAALERERKALIEQKNSLPTGRQLQQVQNKLEKVEKQLQTFQETRNGVKQLYQFNEEMGSLQKAINRFSAFISDPQNTD